MEYNNEMPTATFVSPASQERGSQLFSVFCRFLANPTPTSNPYPSNAHSHHMQAERRERDTQAIKTFEAAVAAISEEMEKRVLEASYTLRDGLEEAEQAVGAVRGELDVDEKLVQGDMTYVEVMYFYV